MTKTSPKPQSSETLERPRVYVTRKGGLYVKADELLRSRRARAVIEKMAKLDFGKNSSSASPKKRQ